MEYFQNKKFPINYSRLLLLFAFGFLIIFNFAFGFHPNNDTEGYIYSIKFFRNEYPDIYPNRYLNPFYPLVAGQFLFFLSPEQALIFLNIVFFFGLVYLSFKLFKDLFKDELTAFIGASFIATGYPMVRYALTQVQDIGGYFWFLATIYAGWQWYKKNQTQWIAIGGICTAFGLLTKESGAMGAVFFGILILQSSQIVSKKIKDLFLFSCWPFVTLVINKYRGNDVGYNSWQWLVDNWHIYAAGNYNFTKWFGVNASTFNVVWFFVIIGLVAFWRNRHEIDKQLQVYFLAVIPSSLSYFAWPLFISRTVYISAWLIVPVALYGVRYVLQNTGWKKAVAVACIVAAIIFPSILQYILRYAHVFKIYEDCNKKIGCSWSYFWTHRNEFSTEK